MVASPTEPSLPQNAADRPVSSSPTWAPEHQMANMLGLCEAQMESALQESDKAVDALIKVFTNLSDTTRSIAALTETLPSEIQAQVKEGLDQQVAVIGKQMGAAVIAFQFYDKLTQRLGHVRYSLSTLALFVCDRSQVARPDQWDRLLKTLRRLYRTEEERQIFQMIMDGIAAETGSPHAAAEQPAVGEVELF